MNSDRGRGHLAAASAPALSGAEGAGPMSPSAPVPGATPLETVDATRYERRHMLGMGGMGTVQVAFDRRLGREVALKEVASLPNPPSDPTALSLEARLAREAAITARLEHPGIVPLYDAGRGPGGQLFYTMRIVRGRSLGDALAAGPSIGERQRLLRHVRDACEAVAWAHRHGIIHRDLKPSNIMVGGFGETQVVDWGLAREMDVADLESRPAETEQDAGLTRVGALIGTPQYLSPEQAAGAPASRRTDVWSLGLVLAEVMGGHRVYDVVSSADALSRIREGAPDLSPLLRDHAPELVAIARRATATRPEDRYPDAKAMADDLTAWLEGRRVSAHDYRPGELLARLVRAWRVPLTVLGLSVLAIIAVVAVAFAENDAERARAEAARASAERERARAVRAEASAREALDASERALGQVLLSNAERHLRRDAMGEAEIMAARVLEVARDPDALGVLLMTRTAAPPAPVLARSLPPCVEGALSADGQTFVCRTSELISAWKLEPLTLLWQAAAAADSLFILEAPTRVGLAHPRGASLLDAATGGALPAPDPLKFHRFVASTPRGTAAVATTGLPLRLGADGRIDDRGALCEEGDAARLGIGDDAGRHVIICARAASAAPASPGEPLLRAATVTIVGLDDATHSFSLDALAIGAPPGPPPAVADWAPASAALVADGALLLVASQAGRVALVEVESGRTRYARQVGETHVSHLVVSSDESVAAIADAAGGPRLLAVADGQWLGRLPGSPVQGMRFLATAPRRLARWQRRGPETALTIDDLPPAYPSSVTVPGGVGALETAGPDIVVAGTGYVEVLGPSLSTRASRPWPAVVKDVALRGDGGAVAVVGQGVDAIEVFTLPDLAPHASAATLHTHRRVAWPDTGILAAPYVGGLLLWRPGGAVVDLLPDTTLVELDATAGAPFAIAIAEGNQRVLRVDLRAEPVVEALPLPEGVRCHTARISDDGERVVCLERERLLWMTVRGEVLLDLDASGGAPLTAVALDETSQRVYLGDLRGRVRVHSLSDGALLARSEAHTERVSALTLRGAGPQRELLSAGWDRRVVRHALATLDMPHAQLIGDANARWGLALDDVLGGDSGR